MIMHVSDSSRIVLKHSITNTAIKRRITSGKLVLMRIRLRDLMRGTPPFAKALRACSLQLSTVAHMKLMNYYSFRYVYDVPPPHGTAPGPSRDRFVHENVYVGVYVGRRNFETSCF